jgi:NAD-dependent dihydropyrimidine dehydrogenase PreA subunit
MLRKIVTIDPDKCDGCGLCVPSCAEGAIKLVDGKAVLSADNLCDGLGACLGECPRDAIRIEERDADEFDEAVVEKHLAAMGKPAPAHHSTTPAAPVAVLHQHHGNGGCPGSRAMSFAPPEAASESAPSGSRQSQLAQWPVQLHLVSTTAPYFQGADLLITADCVPVAYAGYHEDFLKGKAVVMGCPKLDDNNFYTQKLTELLSKSDIKSITVLKMEVPCCGGIAMAARQALAASGKQIAYKEVTIGIQGTIKG